MIHSRIKWLHTEEDTTTKQKTIRSQNTISEKDCRDLTNLNRQRKHEDFDKSLPKVKLCRNRLKGQCCSLPKKRTREAVLRSRLFKGQTRAGRGSVLWKGLWRRSSRGQTEAGRGRVLGRKGRMRAENTWRALGWSWRLRLLFGSDAGGLEAARVFLKTRQTRYVDGQSSKWWRARKTLRPRWAKWTQVLWCSISQHSLWECTALSYIGSRVAAVLVYGSRQRFSTSADPSQGGTFEENFARWLAFTVRTFVAKRRRTVKSLVCSQRGTKYHSGDFCGRSRRRELSPH